MLAIYLYKVTFEETKDFYWGIHLQRKENDGYMGSPVTHAWKWEHFTPKLDILCYFEPTEKGWNEACAVEERVIRPDLNKTECLNEHVGGRPSLEAMKRGQRKGNETNKKNKTGIYGLTQEERVKAGEKGAAAKSAEQQAKAGKASHQKQAENPEAYSERQAKSGKNGGSIGGKKNTESQKKARKKNGDVSAAKTNAQLYRCLVTGKVTTPGALANFHKKQGIPKHMKERVK